jgi:hypothetical protein
MGVETEVEAWQALLPRSLVAEPPAAFNGEGD